MKKNPNHQSGIFNPRVLTSCALCSFGVLLAIVSLAATPTVSPSSPGTKPPTGASLFQNFPALSGANANQLPAGVPLPPGAQFSANGQGDPLRSRLAAGFPGIAGMPLRPGTTS